MSYSIKQNKQTLTANILAITLISLLSVLLAEKLQVADISSFAKMFAFMGLYAFYFLFRKIRLTALLIPFTFSYLSPANYLFYLFLGLFLLLMLGEYLYHRKKNLYIPYSVNFIILIIFGVIALFKAYYLVEGIENFLIVVLLPIILVTGIFNSEFSASDFKIFLKAIVIIAAIVGFLGVIIALRNPDERIGSTWRTAMTINAFYIFSFFISFAFTIVAKNNVGRLFYFLCTIMILFGMLFTYTRIALLSVIFGVFLISVKISKLRKIAIALVLIMLLFVPTSMVERAGRNIFEDPSVIIRLFAWTHSIELFQANPITGIGFETWKNTYESSIPFKWLYAEHPHNVFIKLTLELGLIGMLAYFTFIVRILYRFLKKIKGNPEFEFYYVIFIAILAVIFSCLTDVFIVKLPIAIFFWSTLAFMLKYSDFAVGEINARHSVDSK